MVEGRISPVTDPRAEKVGCGRIRAAPKRLDAKFPAMLNRVSAGPVGIRRAQEDKWTGVLVQASEQGKPPDFPGSQQRPER